MTGFQLDEGCIGRGLLKVMFDLASRALVRNVENFATSLAVHGVGIMSL